MSAYIPESLKTQIRCCYCLTTDEQFGHRSCSFALGYQWLASSYNSVKVFPARHRQIHTLYDNSHLALHLGTLEKLKQDPQLQKFFAWVHKQDPNKRVKIDRKR